MQDLKQHDTEKDPLDEYKGKWRNLWFSKNHGSAFGNTLYGTLIECELGGYSCLKKVKSGRWRTSVFNGKDIPCSDVTHFIPMPAE